MYHILQGKLGVSAYLQLHRREGRTNLLHEEECRFTDNQDNTVEMPPSYLNAHNTHR